MLLDTLSINVLSNLLSDKLTNKTIKGGHTDNSNTILFVDGDLGIKIIHKPVNFNLITLIKRPKLISNFEDSWAKLLINCEIINLHQLNQDRIIEFHLKKTEEWGEVIQLNLIVELTGYHNNLIITSADGTILNAYRFISAQKSSYRQILNEEVYVLPPHLPGFDPVSFSSEDAIDLIISSSLPLSPSITSSLRLKEETALEIIMRAGLPTSKQTHELNEEEKQRLMETLQTLITTIIRIEEGWTLGEIEGKLHLYPFAPLQKEVKVTYASEDPFKVLNKIDLTERTKYLNKADIEKTVKEAEAIITKMRRKSKSLDEKINKYSDWKIYKQTGDILSSFSHKVSKGDKQISLPNLYGEGEIVIKLNPRLDVFNNVDKYYKLARKYKRGLPKLKSIKTTIKNQLDILVTKLNSFNNNDMHLDEFVNFLTNLTLKEPSLKPKMDLPQKLPYKEFTSSDGLKILVGRSARDNDELTFKYAKLEDIWLHAESVQGSHVIIKLAGKKDIPPRTLQQAAALAAYNSKSKHSSIVPVIWTKRKYVHKRRKSKPGIVKVLRYKTIFAKPISKLPELK